MSSPGAPNRGADELVEEAVDHLVAYNEWFERKVKDSQVAVARADSKTIVEWIEQDRDTETANRIERTIYDAVQSLRTMHDLPRRRRRQQPHAQLVAHLGAQPLDECQTPADPALVPTQQLRYFHLAHPVFAHQRVNDPRFFQLTRAAAVTV